jgi:hypothetical protein
MNGQVEYVYMENKSILKKQQHCMATMRGLAAFHEEHIALENQSNFTTTVINKMILSRMQVMTGTISNNQVEERGKTCIPVCVLRRAR